MRYTYLWFPGGAQAATQISCPSLDQSIVHVCWLLELWQLLGPNDAESVIVFNLKVPPSRPAGALHLAFPVVWVLQSWQQKYYMIWWFLQPRKLSYMVVNQLQQRISVPTIDFISENIIMRHQFLHQSKK
jgi:hypothetical protein